MLRREERVTPASSHLVADLMVLFKVRIVSLLLMSALAGLFLGSQGRPGTGPLVLIFVTGALAAMGSSAWNQYLERQSDAMMMRTRKRPLVTGAIARPGWVPYVATLMVALPALAVLPSNPALAFFLAIGAFIYVVIYTIWLKPRTHLNIVVGGLAGSAAVMAGGAAANAWTDPGVVALAILLFFWTPIHFWALAVVYREDYARAKIPMLPVTTTPRTAAVWAFVHGVGAALAAVGLAFLPHTGPLYAIPVAVMTVLLLREGALLIEDPSAKRAYRLFHTSNFYLLAVLVAATIGAAANVPWR